MVELGGPPPLKTGGIFSPTQVDRFILDQEIASGGMGCIVRAYDRELDRWVALKVLHPHLRDSPVARQRLLHEGRCMAQFEHPNIPPILTIGHFEDGMPFFAMPLIQGRNLQSILDALANPDARAQEEFPLATLLTLLKKIGEVVEYAHAQGILHLDLKPQNIMVGRFGEVLVIDWGTAQKVADVRTEPAPSLRPKARPGTEGPTTGGLGLGTRAYMPPEQAEDGPEQVDARTDVFALGGILFAMLTLRAPFEPADLSHATPLLDRTLSPLDRDSLRHLPATAQRHLPHGRVPKTLILILGEALNLNPQRRYQSVLAFMADLDAFRNNQPLARRRSSASHRAFLFFWRHRVALTTAVSGSVLGLALTFYLSLAPQRPLPLTGRVLTGAGKPVPQVSVRLKTGRLDSVRQIPDDLRPAHKATLPALNFPATEGSVFQEFWPGHPVDQIAAVFTCDLKVAHSGTYSFQLESDDGAQLILDGTPLLSLDGMHWVQTTNGTAWLTGTDQGFRLGRHQLRVKYFERRGPSALRVWWSKPTAPAAFPTRLLGGSVNFGTQSSAWQAQFYLTDETIMETLTGTNGAFRFNPVSRNQDFQLFAKLPGQSFLPAERTNNGTGQADFVLVPTPKP
jgi:serine/threonine protein kinase